MHHESFASPFRRQGGSNRRQLRKRAQFTSQLLQLEERCLMAAPTPLREGGIPVPDVSLKNQVLLSSIFWNGGAPIAKKGGVSGLKSPEANNAMKTITITNFSNEFIYPFMRSENSGQAKGDEFYDPQDNHNQEFREYVGYSVTKGNTTNYFLGLPPHATIKIQVPLVLWDGNHLTLATVGKDLTATQEPLSNVFGYSASAQITLAQTAPVSGSVWVQGSNRFPAGFKPLVMFYHANSPLAVGNDAPAQLVEITYRDPFLKKLGVTDSSQTFPELSYDVSYVNTLHAPAALEASLVPITSGSPKDNNLQYYKPHQDWGWNGSNKSTTAFNPLVKAFVENKGRAGIGQYFGGKGWPQYYNPNKNVYVIPSGANVFDDSPLDTRPSPDLNGVHTSHYDSNRWLLSSSGGGAIHANANGTAQSGTGSTRQIALSSFPNQAARTAFAQNVASMQASKQTINVTISGNANYPGVLGTFAGYNPSSSVISYTVGQHGSGYNKSNTQLVISKPDLPNGVQAKGQINFGPNGSIDTIGILPNWGGSGYTKPPTVRIVSNIGKGATATAAITGGTVTMNLGSGQSLPTTGQSYVFQRLATDYATTDITNLWYSWAQYYVNYYAQKFPNYSQSAQGTLVYDKIGLDGPFLTNGIKFQKLPPNLAVGMTVSAPVGIPKGTTVLEIVKNTDNTYTVYLSQIPGKNAPTNQQYTFGLPAASALPSSPFTKPYTLSFDAKKLATNNPPVPDPTAFAGAVYEAMAVEATAPMPQPPNNYLANTMYVVDNVIKFNADIPTNAAAGNGWDVKVVAQARDIVKSILRGVVSYIADPNQDHWYPEPDKKVAGTMINGQQAKFNVFNLDPYVWFVHKVEGLSGYGFSVDDDVANPIAPGPDDPKGNPTGLPNDLQTGFAGLNAPGANPLGNQQEWFPTTRWGKIVTMATVGYEKDNPTYNGVPIITLVPTKAVPNPLRTLNQIALPGPGQFGATITAPDNPGIFKNGTTLVFFPDGPDQPKKENIQLSEKPNRITTKPIRVVIDGAPPQAGSLALFTRPRFRLRHQP